MLINWSAVETGIGVAIAAAIAAFPAIRTVVNKYAPVFAALGTNVHTKNAVADAQAAIAATTSSARMTDIQNAITQAIVAVKELDPQLTELETVAVKELASSLVAPAHAAYVQTAHVAQTLQSIQNAKAAAAHNTLVQAVQEAGASKSAT